jgi:hypothetical protein
MIASQHPGRRIEVWFQDEARFGQQGTITRKWAPTGSRPPAVKQTQYDWLYVIGAVCPESGRSVGMLSPYIDTQIMNIFLQGLSRQIAPDVRDCRNTSDLRRGRFGGDAAQAAEV